MQRINLSHARLVADPQIKHGKYDMAIFTLAVENSRPDKNGDYQSTFYRCTLFGKRVKTIEQYYHKGSVVSVSGSLTPGIWEGNGKPRLDMNVNVDDFDLPLRQPKPKQNNTQQKSNDPFADNGDAIDIDNDLPF